jgi:cytochrome o ubiquinol oxidase operon protein cyoD
MKQESGVEELKKNWHGSLKSYLIGFVLSVILTIASFSLVMTGVISGSLLLHVVITLGILQFIVQSLFFLHVGQESTPYWETLLYLFMVMVLVIIVGGSLWIIFDLNSRMM